MPRVRVIESFCFLFACICGHAQAPLTESVLDDFEGPSRFVPPVGNHSAVQVVEKDGGHALEVKFDAETEWPNVMFANPQGPWNWTDQTGIAVDVFNPEADSVSVSMRVDNPGADGSNHCVTVTGSALPGRVTTLRALFGADAAGPFWGMRGVPVLGPIGKAKVSIDSAQVVAFQLFLSNPVAAHTLLLDNIRLVKLTGPLDQVAPLPIVDPFGQYKHADWPGKIHSESELTERAAAEQADLTAHAPQPELDTYGGAIKGPALDATGWFRTAQLNGKWWLVTPEGHVFLSMGIDCIAAWEGTFVEKREPWFEWLPAENDEQFKSAFGEGKNAHSMAETINGSGRTFSFYRANLVRKYGAEWPARWRDTSAARLRSWGFNTVGNWSQGDMINDTNLPFVATLNITGDFKRIEGGGGYWAKLVDPYDPDFATAAKRSVLDATKAYAANPRCVGYFADNEMAWAEIEYGVLNSPVKQPARDYFIESLRQRYINLDTLNAAWGTHYDDWDGVRTPTHFNSTSRSDIDGLIYAFAHHYFEIVRDAIKENAPNQLYLGCRFASAPLQVVKACTDVADVVSFNIYRSAIGRDEFAKSVGTEKPILIGEFHVGALDRGMFHTGLVAAADQADRAGVFAKYVRSVVDNPAVVGCHWFQYVDEPVTGRWYDGENYNIGFVTVTDTPYPEMVDAARAVFGEMYARRLGNPQ